jgi:hypothetical protein
MDLYHMGFCGIGLSSNYFYFGDLWASVETGRAKPTAKYLISESFPTFCITSNMIGDGNNRLFLFI